MKQLSEHDQQELEKFRKWLTITHWRETELGENKLVAQQEAGIVVYGNRFCGPANEKVPISDAAREINNG